MSQKNVPQDTIVPMYRISILVVVFCVFAGAIFCSFDSHHKKEVELEALEAFHREASQKALIIFATRASNACLSASGRPFARDSAHSSAARRMVSVSRGR